MLFVYPAEDALHYVASLARSDNHQFHSRHRIGTFFFSKGKTILYFLGRFIREHVYLRYNVDCLSSEAQKHEDQLNCLAV